MDEVEAKIIDTYMKEIPTINVMMRFLEVNSNANCGGDCKVWQTFHGGK